MADIDIERKRGSFWPWLVGALAIIFVAWIVTAAMDDDEGVEDTVAGDVTSTPGAVGTTGTSAGAVGDFVEFAEAPPADASDMGRAHEYTAEGLRKLDAALGALVDARPNERARAELDGFRQSARRIQENPASMKHAGEVRDAFTRAAATIGSLDQGAGQEVRSAAERIKGDQPLLDQRDEVHTFFRQSAEAIQRLSAQAG